MATPSHHPPVDSPVAPPDGGSVGTPATILAVVRMTRPDQLLLVVVVFLLGVLVGVGSGGVVRAPRVLAGLVAVVVTAASIHLANEFADVDTDALSTRTPFSGGSGARARTPVSAGVVAGAVVWSAVLAVVLVVGLLVAGLVSGWLAAIVAVAAALGWQYSLPPLALSRRGWGEVDNAVLGGILLPHAGAAAVAPPDLAACLAVLPFSLLVFANLLATQWPDRWADAAVGKYTLATRWTPRRLRLAHRATIVLAAGLLLALPTDVVPVPVRVASLVAAPFAGWAMATYTTDDVPTPTVALMIAFLVAMFVGWGVDVDLTTLASPY